MTSAQEHLHDPVWESVNGPLLIAGDVRDLPLILDICRRLPFDAEGSVILEAAARIQTRYVEVPCGVSVTWLLRSEGTTARPRGERLGTAVHAWCMEWTCGEPSDPWTLWLGPHVSAHVARMARGVLGLASPPRS